MSIAVVGLWHLGSIQIKLIDHLLHAAICRREAMKEEVQCQH
jgi:hypothetical protein